MPDTPMGEQVAECIEGMRAWRAELEAMRPLLLGAGCTRSSRGASRATRTRGPTSSWERRRTDLRCCTEGRGLFDSSTRRGATRMTGKADFTQDEWKLVLEAPPSAGLIVLTAQKGGTFRETIAMAKAYTEARQEHGESELLDEITAAKPERDHTHYHSPEELKQGGLQHLRDAVALLETKATPDEVGDYRRFILTLANKVAGAHREHGENVTDAEHQAIAEITTALGADGT